jgi:hypothetical protein
MNLTNKKYILLLAIGLFALKAFSQDAIDRYFEKYAEDPEFTSISISSKMFSLFSEIDADDPDSQEVLEAMSGLTGIRILSREDSTGRVNYATAIDKIGKEYELLLSVDEKDEKVRFFVREENGRIAELFMMVGGDYNLFLMSILGDIDLNKISKISKNMNVGGMNYLENLDEESNE